MKNKERRQSSPPILQRRAVLAGLLVGPALARGGSTARAGPASDERSTWWVHLSEPALADRPGDPEAQRRLRLQQDAVMARLRALGAVEVARVLVIRNALAVRLSGDTLVVARGLAGVTAITRTRDQTLQSLPDTASSPMPPSTPRVP